MGDGADARRHAGAMHWSWCLHADAAFGMHTRRARAALVGAGVCFGVSHTVAGHAAFTDAHRRSGVCW
jgi:hypothetical protein